MSADLEDWYHREMADIAECIRMAQATIRVQEGRREQVEQIYAKRPRE